MIIIIDNYDSFTYNVYQALAKITTEEIRVLRSRECTIADIEKLNPSRLIVSPGPGRPEDAGISVEAIKHFAGKLPILGVCLGHQAIGYAFGAKIVQAKFIKHGIAEEIDLDGKGLFRTIGKKNIFTRYHSLVIDESTLSSDFEVTARATDGDIMGIRHKTLPIEGVQFHPESIASGRADEFFKAFLNYRREPLDIRGILNTLTAGKDLSRETAEMFMEDLTDGIMDERQMAAILTALSSKGPVTEEIAGCAKVLSSKKRKFPYSGDELTDIVGTGGDGKGSFNVSSLSGLIAASCGAKIAKHGNRAVSSKSGAADFYTAAGFKLDMTPEKAASVIDKTNFVFLMAPVYHSAMRFAGPVRGALGVKTIMNLLGPLTNPAEAKYLMLGVYSKSILEPFTKAAKSLGAKRVMVAISDDGYDEISPCVPTTIAEILEDGEYREYRIDPKEFGVPAVDPEDLAGGTGVDNFNLALDVLNGNGRPGIKYACALNAGAALYISKKAASIKEGFDKAMKAMEDGSVLKKIEEVKVATNS
jgi:anthranilate synthase/phosphoribosyltransferase